MRSCTIALLLASNASAQPDAREVLNQVHAAYAKVRGYELLATVTRASKPEPATIAVAYGAPDRLMVQDKSTNTIRSFSEKDYGTIHSGAAERSEALVNIGFTVYTAITEHLQSARLVRQEDVTIEGQPYNCTVVEAVYPKDDISVYWVDAARHVVLREEQRTGGGAPYHTIQVVKLHWNADLSASFFDMSRLPANLTGSSLPIRKPSRCSVESRESRIARLQGMVRLRLTVDPRGIPQNVDVPVPLGLGTDELAVSCVSQERYQPAKRDGHPMPFPTERSIMVQADRSSDWALTGIQFQLPGGVTRPTFLKANYPPSSGAIGRAMYHLSFTIDSAGSPRDIRILDANQPYDADAVKIVRSWRFKPAMEAGKPAGYSPTLPCNSAIPKCDLCYAGDLLLRS